MRRSLHGRSRRSGGPTGFAAVPKINRELTPNEETNIDTTIQKLEADKQPYQVIANTLKEYLKQQGIPPKTNAWIRVMQRLGRLKAKMINPSATGGRPNIVDEAISRGYTTKDTIYDQLLTYQSQQEGKKWNQKQIFTFLMKWLSEKYNLQITSWRTVERWLQANPIPPNYEEQHAKPFQTWKTFTDPQLNPYWGRLEKELFPVAKESYKESLPADVKNFWLYMKSKNNPALLNPKNWTPQDVQDWINYLYDVRGLSSNTIRGYLVGVRRLLEIGVGWNKKQIDEIRIKKFGQKTQKKLPEKIEFFSAPQIRNMVNNVPESITYQVFSKKKGKPITKHFIADPTLRLSAQSGMQTMADTGARVGFIPKIRWFMRHLEATNLYERIFNDANGVCSIRLGDINIDIQVLFKQPGEEEKFQPVTMWTITKIHEKSNETWSNKGQGIFITPAMQEHIKPLLCMRLGLPSTTDNTTLKTKLTEYVEQKKQEFDAIAAQGRNTLNQIKEQQPAQLNQARRELAIQLRNKYCELLLHHPDPDFYHNAMYTSCENAIHTGNPVRDNQNNIVDATALASKAHKSHLFRKSFVQNLKLKGYHLEDIIDFQIGWTDLSTAKLFYGGTDPTQLEGMYNALKR